MTTAALAQLLPTLLEEFEGGDGFWHGQRDDVAVYVIADDEHDRMRAMSPVGELRRTDSEFLSLLLQANFDRALDAKYALRRRELWSVFMHPLSTLVPDDLGLYLDQVVRLVKNTGSTYASSDLIFGVGDEDDLDIEFVAEGEEEEDGDDSEEAAEAIEEDDDPTAESPRIVRGDDIDDDFDEDDDDEGEAGRGPRRLR